MKIKEFKKEIEGVFKQPVKRYYLGKIKYYTPYFEPWGFNEKIISLRKLGDGRSKPMVRRLWNRTFTLFGSEYWIGIGRPFAIKTVNLGWKGKWNSPRFEWSPSFQIWFFNWQFCIYWTAPSSMLGSNIDSYWEQALWYLHFYPEYSSNQPDIVEARALWWWVNSETKLSTWDDSYLTFDALTKTKL